MMQTFDTYQAAADAKSDDDVISATMKRSGEWSYFLTPVDADKRVVTETAFEVREGTPMEPMQRWLLNEALGGDE